MLHSEEEIDNSTDLIDSGIIDSLALVMLVGLCEEQFDCNLEPEDLIEDNFRTLDIMANFIGGKMVANVRDLGRVGLDRRHLASGWVLAEDEAHPVAKREGKIVVAGHCDQLLSEFLGFRYGLAVVHPRGFDAVDPGEGHPRLDLAPLELLFQEFPKDRLAGVVLAVPAEVDRGEASGAEIASRHVMPSLRQRLEE